MNLSKLRASIKLMLMLLALCPPSGARQAPVTQTPPSGGGSGIKKPDKCEQSALTVRNWELIGRDYVFFDYVLCPKGLQPPAPLVRVWLTTRGDGFAVDKWSEARDGADSVSVYRGKKPAFTLYRDLDAVPLTIFKAERRSSVPAETARQPFMVEPPHLIPFDNLTPESAEKVRKVFASADVLVRLAQRKGVLLNESPKIGLITDALADSLKIQQ
jgi:hypothetical protein